jgi:hypothetical protein
MKKIFIVLTCLFCAVAFSETTKSISGRVTLAKGLALDKVKQGTLFIFAKKAGTATTAGTPPLAVLRLPQPQFPVEFSLSEQNAMMPGTPFEGPFVITARFSPSGDALDKSGPQGMTNEKKKIKLGDKNIVVELNLK